MTATCNADPAAYAAEGYCLFRKVLNRKEIMATRVELDAMLGNLPVRQVFIKTGNIRRSILGPSISLNRTQ